MLKFYPPPTPEIQTLAENIVTSGEKYVDMTQPPTSGHLLLESSEILDAVLLIAVHGGVTCMSSPEPERMSKKRLSEYMLSHEPKKTRTSSTTLPSPEPEPKKSGPTKIYRMSMSSIGDAAYMNDLYTNHIVLYIHSFLENIKEKEAEDVKIFCALSIVCATLAIFYKLPFDSSNIFQISDITTSTFDKVYGRYKDTGKCNDFNMVLHYIKSHESHQRSQVYCKTDPIAHSTLMRNNFSNIRNLYIIDLSCNVLDQKTLFDRKIETIQQLGHCSFQIQYKSPLLASLFSSFGFEEQHYKYFEKDNKKLLVEKNETDQDHYMNEARAKIEKIKSEVTEKIQIQIDVQVRQPCLIIKELDELHKKLNDIIRFLNNNHLNIDSDNYEYTELIKEAKYVKIKVITQMNEYQIFRCNQDNLFFDLDQ